MLMFSRWLCACLCFMIYVVCRFLVLVCIFVCLRSALCFMVLVVAVFFVVCPTIVLFSCLFSLLCVFACLSYGLWLACSYFLF